jgi:membrane associated rhomboid family serine protease
MIPIRNAVPSRYPPVVTGILIATNCLVFLFQDSLSPDELELFLRQFALIPARYSEALASGESDLAAVDFVPFFTMMFLHGGWLHLILNMWTLWLFGPAIEDRLGHLRYLVFFLACGLAASAAHVMFNPTSIVPALGASGAQSPVFSEAICGYFRWRVSSWWSRSCSSRCSSKSTHSSLSVCGSCFRFRNR